VRPDEDGRLKGYLYMNTVSMAHSSGWQMWYTVKITVEDAAGNRSHPRLFRVNFNGNRQDEVRRWEKSQLASRGLAEVPLLGRISVDLIPLEEQPLAAGFFVGAP
jgi:hypothetical protein